MLQSLRCDCIQDSAWSVSVYREEDEDEGEDARMRITLLFRKVSARCCVAASPI
jgi:hypothetical protein